MSRMVPVRRIPVCLLKNEAIEVVLVYELIFHIPTKMCLNLIILVANQFAVVEFQDLGHPDSGGDGV